MPTDVRVRRRHQRGSLLVEQRRQAVVRAVGCQLLLEVPKSVRGDLEPDARPLTALLACRLRIRRCNMAA